MTICPGPKAAITSVWASILSISWIMNIHPIGLLGNGPSLPSKPSCKESRLNFKGTTPVAQAIAPNECRWPEDIFKTTSASFLTSLSIWAYGTRWAQSSAKYITGLQTFAALPTPNQLSARRSTITRRSRTSRPASASPGILSRMARLPCGADSGCSISSLCRIYSPPGLRGALRSLNRPPWPHLQRPAFRTKSHSC
jgi:hypothetical protein